MSILVAGLTLVSAFLITFLLMPSLIRYFRAKKEGQQIREEGPTWHEKRPAPRRWGLTLHLVSSTNLRLGGAWQGQLNGTLGALLFTLIAYGLIGMWDDSIKIFNHQNEGFKPWQKFLAQVVGAMVFAVIYQHEGFQMGFGLTDWGWFYALFIIFWMVGFSNAVNLTDGLDGLVTGLATISFAAYLVLALVQGQTEVALFCLAMIGTLLGFFPSTTSPPRFLWGIWDH